MTGWQKADMRDLGNPLELSGRLETAVMAFITSVQGRIPAGFGVFSRYDRESQLETWYFSPEASVLAASFGGEPCERPEPDETFGFLQGAESSKEIHFPAHFPRRWASE